MMFRENGGQRPKYEIMEGVECVSSRKPERNTVTYERANGDRVTRLHFTDVVTVADNGRVTLDTGGWNTPTTRDRISRYAPQGFSMFTDSGMPFVRTPKGTFPHVDGASYHSTGTPVKPSLHKNIEQQVKADKKLIADFIRKAKTEGYCDPAGDPWLPLNGDLVSRSTALDWLQTGYVTRWVVAAALMHAGMTHTGVAMLTPRNAGEPVRDIALTKLRRYLKKSLGHST